MNRPPRPADSGRTLVGVDAPHHVDHGIKRSERETPNEGTDLSDLQMLGPLGPPEAVQHLCGRLAAVDGRLKAIVDESKHARQIVERAAAHSRMAVEASEDAREGQRQGFERVDVSLGVLNKALLGLMPLPESLAHLSRSVIDLQKAVVRLDERLNRAERRGDSHSEIVERVASLHIEDETTEVKARSLAVLRAHEQRTAALIIVKRIAKWVFAGGGAALLGAAIARGCGG